MLPWAQRLSHARPCFIVGGQLGLHLSELQKDLCRQNCYKEAHDCESVYLCYSGTMEVTLVLDCVSRDSWVFFPMCLTSDPFHIRPSPLT